MKEKLEKDHPAFQTEFFFEILNSDPFPQMLFDFKPAQVCLTQFLTQVLVHNSNPDNSSITLE
jgi:hypothetical protein